MQSLIQSRMRHCFWGSRRGFRNSSTKTDCLNTSSSSEFNSMNSFVSTRFKMKASLTGRNLVHDKLIWCKVERNSNELSSKHSEKSIHRNDWKNSVTYRWIYLFFVSSKLVENLFGVSSNADRWTEVRCFRDELSTICVETFFRRFLIEKKRFGSLPSIEKISCRTLSVDFLKNFFGVESSEDFLFSPCWFFDWRKSESEFWHWEQRNRSSFFLILRAFSLSIPTLKRKWWIEKRFAAFLRFTSRDETN